MPRLIIELREDIRFDEGAWQPVDDRARALVDAVTACCKGPRRLFSRPAAVLDRERIAVRHADGLPDLNLFYVVEGDAAELASHELVAAVELLGDDRPLADTIDVAASALAPGQPLVLPQPIDSRSAWAAAELAARRGVKVVAAAGQKVPAWVRSVTIAPADKLPEIGATLSALPVTGRARVTLESVILVSGGDLGTSELYVEGWVEDDGERTPFRAPQKGAVRGVNRGDTVELEATVYTGAQPVTGELVVHFEVWEEDLGRKSLINPDDLLGIHEARFSDANHWGEGRHDNVHTHGGEGEAIVTYRVELVPP